MQRKKLPIRKRCMGQCWNNPKISFNVLYVEKMNIYSVYISKQNSDHKKNHFFNESQWRKMALSCIKVLREITSEHDVDFCCLTCLHIFRTKKPVESHKKYVEMKICVVF